MISTTVSGTPVWLSPFPANECRVNATFEKPTIRDIGKSAREHRVPVAAALRASFSFKTHLNPAEAQTLRDFLRDLDTKPVLVPFWPAEELASNYGQASVGGALRVWFEPDWSAWGITTTQGAASPLTVTPTLRTCPLGWGRLSKAPTYKVANGLGDGMVSIDFTETGPAAFALTPKTVTLSFGTMVGGQQVPLLTAPIDWSSPPEQSTSIIVERDKVGYGRSDVESFVAQAARRTQTIRINGLDSAEIGLLLYLFHERDASAKAWWCPAAHSSQAGDRLLVRFTSDKLSVSWSKPALGNGNEIANSTIEVTALPTELSIPNGETAGVTIGSMPMRWWGYVVTLGAGASVYRYTSYESDVNAGALGTFTRAPIEHGEMVMELNLAKHECALTVGAFTGSPFELLRTQANGADVVVQILQGDVANPSAAVTVFTGKLTRPSFDGVVMKAKIAGLTSLFDTQVPVQIASKRCWTPMYSSLCGLSKAALGVAANLTNIGADGTLVLVASGANGWPAVSQDHYRFGFAKRTLSNGIVQTFPITASSYVGAGQTLPNPWSVGYRTTITGTTLTAFPDIITDQYGGTTYSVPVGGYCQFYYYNIGAGPAIRTHAHNQYTPVARFTAPSTGTYSVYVETNNQAGGFNSHTVNAYVLKNGVVLTSKYCSAATGELVYSASIALTAGDTVEFTHNNNGDGSYDTTGLIFNVGIYSLVSNWLSPIPTGTSLYLSVVNIGTQMSAASVTFPESGWIVYPGCDHSWERCKELGNSARFRGFPRFPKANPALVAIKQDTPAGGKK